MSVTPRPVFGSNWDQTASQRKTTAATEQTAIIFFRFTRARASSSRGASTYTTARPPTPNTNRPSAQMRPFRFKK